MSQQQVEIHVYNTLTKRKERFVPRTEGEVSIYVCGVTPYDVAHIGHARPSVFFDVVRRYFTYTGQRVRFIQNFTDIDDKIIERANARGVSATELANHYADEYLSSMDRLGVLRADRYPKVSEHIDDIVAMIEQLIANGSAYEKDGNVFFAVDTFESYGKLSNQQKEELQAGADVEAAEGKRSPLDFALWKAAKPGEPAWPSPWGDGRPGWHIECSAMSLKYLGSGFDIHGGGLDLIFPHHENEIAQSESYAGEPFVRYWLHNGLVTFGGEKMSKSLGNFVTVDELLEQYHPALVRHALLHQHYRSPMEYSEKQMEGVQKGWERLNRTYHAILRFGAPLDLEDPAAVEADESLKQASVSAKQKFMAAMADDFNTPVAIAALFELVRALRPYVGDAQVDDQSKVLGIRLAAGVLEQLGGQILGIVSQEPLAEDSGPGEESSQLIDGLVRLLIAERAELRKAKQWDRADAIRDGLDQLGIALIDTPEGTQWTFKKS